MYRRGHWGVALLVYAPIGFALVVSGRPALAVVGGGVMLWLSMLPDLDHRVPGLSHRGVTHTLAFAALIGLFGGSVGAALATVVGGSEATLVPFGVAIGTLAMLAHLLADALTPAGIPLLWPLSTRTVTLSLVRADSALVNYVLLATGVCATAVAGILAIRIG